jgi:hypothetical protein
MEHGLKRSSKNRWISEPPASMPKSCRVLALPRFSGFGLLGMAVSAGPPQIAGAMGFYGLGWSVYSNLVARGGEVTFEKNAALAIKFGTSPKSLGGETLRAARPTLSR